MAQADYKDNTISTESRYLFDPDTDQWYDQLTKTYLEFDQSSGTYTPVAIVENEKPKKPASNDVLRLVVLSSTVLKNKSVALIDSNGVSVGRDKSWMQRLRLPEMAVSKYHAQICHDNGSFHVTDVGSRNGTFLNGDRLSESNLSSIPKPLKHLDKLEIGMSEFQVHYHPSGWPCADCETNTNDIIDLSSKKKKKGPENNAVQQSSENVEQRRRRELQRLKKLTLSPSTQSSSDYLDRASMRRQREAESQKKKIYQHLEQRYTPLEEGVVHATLQTQVDGKGSRMLRKMGWIEGTGLGKEGDGILEPITPSSQTERAGLGSSFANNNVNIDSKKAREALIMMERYKNRPS